MKIISYPNPAKGHSVSVKIAAPVPCIESFKSQNHKNQNNKIEIYDFFNHLVYRRVFSSTEMILNNLNLKSGKYIIVLTTPKSTLREILLIE